jgi:hypothetical protein
MTINLIALLRELVISSMPYFNMITVLRELVTSSMPYFELIFDIYRIARDMKLI